MATLVAATLDMILILSIMPRKFSKVSLKNFFKTFLLVLKCIFFLLGVGVDSDSSRGEWLYLYHAPREVSKCQYLKRKISESFRCSHWKVSISPFLELLISLPVPGLSSFFFLSMCPCLC